MALNVSLHMALKSDIERGMDDVKAGRVKPMDMATIKARGRAAQKIP